MRTVHAAFLFFASVVLLAPPGQADLIGHGGMVRSVDVSADGQRVITGSFDYTARVWNFGDQSELAVLDLHEGPVTSVAISPDGKRALTTSDDFKGILWDLGTYKPIHTLSAHKHKVMTSAFSSDGKLAATGSWDKTVIIWDLETGTRIQTIQTNSPVNAVRFVAADTQLITGGHHPTIEMWDIKTGDTIGKLEGHKMGITALSSSPDGKQILSASIDKTVKLWDIAGQFEIREIPVRDGQVYDVSFSPDGKRALTAGKDGYVVEWDVTNGKALHEVPAHERIAWSARYTPDGRFAVSTSSDEQARIWHLETGDRIGLTKSTDDEPKPWLESDHPGAKLYTKCAKCHALTADGPSRSGPHFGKLFGRVAGSVPDYRYSSAMQNLDFSWNEKTLFRLFSEGPDKMLPGTKMPVQQVTDDQQLTELVDYLRNLTSDLN